MLGALKINLNRRKAITLVGLDIQPGYVVAVQARVNGEIVVERSAGAALPADTMRDGELLNPDALTSTLKQMFASSDLDRRVRIGVANQRTVLRMLELPPITDRKELAAAVRFQAEDQVPMPLNNAVLDFHPVGMIDTPEGPRQRVAVVAAQRDMVEKLLAAVREAGLRPEAADLSAFAMIRSLYRPAPEADGRVLYLNVGGLTNMAIANGTTCHFTRVVGGGLEAMAVEIAERRSISLEQARTILSGTRMDPSLGQESRPTLELVSSDEDGEVDADPTRGLSRPVPTESTQGMPSASVNNEDQAVNPDEQADIADHDRVGDEASESEVTSHTDIDLVLANGARGIAGDVRNSLDFYRSLEGGASVTSVVLSGPALEVDGFAEMLENDLGLPVHPETVRSEEQNGGVSPHRLAIAAGLAAEEIHT